MATTAQRALLTALSMIVLASLAAGRVISPESVWAGEPALELPHKAAVPELLVSAPSTVADPPSLPTTLSLPGPCTTRGHTAHNAPLSLRI